MFKSVRPDYTGGGIYIFTGQMDNGDYFMADTSFYDARLLTEDPMTIVGYNSRLDLNEYAMDSVEWQEAHLVRDLEPDQAKAFFIDMLEWVKANKPDGNYLPSEMDYFLGEVKSLQGAWR